MSKNLSNIDHVAVQVNDVSDALLYYEERFECEVTYQDTTWALLKFENINLALVTKDQHPYHFAVVDKKLSDENIKYHRDGIGYIYTKDLDGNFIEILDRSSR